MTSGNGRDFDILVIAQAGRLQYEAVLFAASLRAMDPGFAGTLYVAVPEPGPIWARDPGIAPDVRAALADLGAQILPFENRHFGQSYPQGNKIEALAQMPEGRPFVFFDSDTLITGPLSELQIDFQRPTASMQREGTWPEVPLYGPGYDEIWGALYRRFGLDFASSLDTSQPQEYWERYLYFNAGWFLGPDARAFGETFRDVAVSIRDDRPPELASQSLDPWLDQVALPLVIHALGGGRPGPELGGLDGDVTCHWRVLPLLYARAPDRVIEVLEEVAAPNRIKKVLKGNEAMLRMIYQGRGQKVRAMFDRSALPRTEKQLRNQIRKAGHWMR